MNFFKLLATLFVLMMAGVTANAQAVPNVQIAPLSTSGCPSASLTPCPAPGITGAVTASALSSLVLLAVPGRLFSVYATNLTSTAGFLVILNATSAPVDGAIIPLECVPLPASGNASINYNPGPAANFSIGIVAIVTSASTCFTKTTGTITAFIKGVAISVN